MASVPIMNFPSSTTPGKTYTVSRDDNGNFWCECWVWKRKRSCQHTQEVERKRLEPGITATATYHAPKSKLQSIVEEVVEILKGGR